MHLIVLTTNITRVARRRRRGGRFSRNHCYAKWKRNDRPVTDDVNAGLEPQALRPGLEEFESNLRRHAMMYEKKTRVDGTS